MEQAVRNIIRVHEFIDEFWGDGAVGWASEETANPLAECRLDRMVALSRLLPDWLDDSNKRDEGNLLLAWVTLGAMSESILKWFLSVYREDYMRSAITRWNRSTKCEENIEPDALFLREDDRVLREHRVGK